MGDVKKYNTHRRVIIELVDYDDPFYSFYSVWVYQYGVGYLKAWGI